ncbi:MAG: LysR family transcriptional regulator [Paracoccaceae bacterium]
MPTENWDEIRTAYQVARAGTVSGAAEVLGVHHATVIRHVDALEQSLGVKLFQRHSRGYTPTEAGQDLLKVAAATDDQLSQLVGRIKGRGGSVAGELIITTVAGFSNLLTPALARFQALHPDLSIRYLTDHRLYRLEYGEAHVAVRAGPIPQEPDNVVQPLVTVMPRLCAAPDYIRRFGKPESLADLAQHRFVGGVNETARAPFLRWLMQQVPAQNIVYRASEDEAMEAAVRAGVGIGFIAAGCSAGNEKLVDILAPDPAWQSTLWLVSHVDLHRTAKVQAILAHLKQEARQWQKS